MKINLTILFLFFLISCNNKEQKNALVTKNSNKSIDTINNINNKKMSNFENADILTVLNKMRNKQKLIEVDYIAINDFILNNSDESKSEEVGYTIFEYLWKNKSNNNAYLSYLNKMDEIQKEKILNNLVQIICIDLGEEDYSYDNFIIDFELFKNSASAKKAFKECMNNQVE